MDEIVLVQTDTKEAVTSSYPPTAKYVAISYRWGSVPSWELKTPNYTATVSAFYQQHFNILLAWVYHTLNIPYVWIDAICINQASRSDKARQLGSITRLFHDATAVIAAPWLSQPRDADMIRVFGDWTRRCWVAAEIHSAQVIYYTAWNWSEGWMWGDHSRPEHEGFCPPGADPATMSEDEGAEHVRMSNTVVMLRKGRPFGGFHVDEVAKIAVELVAKEDSDKLYALMPMTGVQVPRQEVQMTLGQFIVHLMESLGQVDQMRLVMGVSRFRGYGTNMSWAFGPGAEYRAPWANNEYLEETGGASVVLNDGRSLTINARYHLCELKQGDQTAKSEFYRGSCDPPVGGDLFYHPQTDRPRQGVVLISCGLDCRKRVVGITVDCESREKIGVFMLETDHVGWDRGPNIVR